MFISRSANWPYVRERSSSSIYGRLIVQKGKLIDILRILLHGVLGFQLDIFLPFKCKINWPSKDPLYYYVTSRKYFAFILGKILSLQGYNWTKVVNFVENCTKTTKNLPLSAVLKCSTSTPNFNNFAKNPPGTQLVERYVKTADSTKCTGVLKLGYTVLINDGKSALIRSAEM